jgi:hypothetical protein
MKLKLRLPLFLGLRQMYVTFIIFFSRRPLYRAAVLHAQQLHAACLPQRCSILFPVSWPARRSALAKVLRPSLRGICVN